MSKPFEGTVDLDIRDSVPDWERFEPPKAPDGAPRVVYGVFDDVGSTLYVKENRLHYVHNFLGVTADYPGTDPFRVTGGTISRVAVDVSGDAYIDLEREAQAMLMRTKAASPAIDVDER